MRVIFLADGPHQIEPPRVPAFIYLQRLGYEMEGMFGPSLVIEHDDKTEPNIESIADHLCALLVASEPEKGWTHEKVAEGMEFDRLPDYFVALRELANEGAGGADPKASSETTPPQELPA